MGKEQDEAKKWAEENIRIDKGTLPEYGSDQTYAGNPERIAVVTYGLESTEGLVQEAEEVRKAENNMSTPEDDLDYEVVEVPDTAERTAKDYEFELSITDTDGGKTDNCMTIYDSVSESVRSIDLTEAQQAAAYEQLDSQSKEIYGQSCRELLDESKKNIERHFEAKEQQTDEFTI